MEVLNPGERIKRRRRQLDLTLEQVAMKVGVTRATIQRYEAGEFSPKRDVAKKLGEALKVSPAYIMGYIDDSDECRFDMPRIPVLGYVAAGKPIDAVENILEYVDISPVLAKKGEFFALRIKGESMAPRMSDGDLVIVRKQSDIESGQIGVAMINCGEATVKRIIKGKNYISLVPLNPEYQPQIFSIEEVKTLPVVIIGKVVELRATY